MIHPFTVLEDALHAVQEHRLLLFGILLLLTVSYFLLDRVLRRIVGDRLSAEEYFALSLGGWLLPALLISLLWAGGALLLSASASIVIVLLVICALGLALFRRPVPKISTAQRTWLLLIILTVFFLLLRLAFVGSAVFPQYFDSAQHYLWIRDLLDRLNHAQGSWSLTSYYHLGFHFLAAFLSLSAGAPIEDVMLVLGQVILAILPFPLFFILRHGTGSNMAAMFALLLAAFGWYMPAHAVDWGKYPALASLALIPFVLSLGYLSLQNRTSLSRAQNWLLHSLLLLAIFASIFLHSRALIVLVLVAISWGATLLWSRLSALLRLLILGLVTGALILGVQYIQTKGILGPLLDPYGLKAILVTSVVVFLSLFAYRSYSAFVFACLLTTCLVLLCIFVPLGSLIPGYQNMTVLDRPFVEMMLYLPLALVGGFGLAGLEQFIQSRSASNGDRQRFSSMIGVLLIGLVVVQGVFKYDLYPSDCCDLVSYDDLEAIEWIGTNLPGDTRILISSTTLNVLPTNISQGDAGGDAGIWINPLTRRVTVLMPFTTDFNQPETRQAICNADVEYVYVGKAGWPFNDSGITAHPEWYRLIFSIPDAKIYELVGCG